MSLHRRLAILLLAILVVSGGAVGAFYWAETALHEPFPAGASGERDFAVAPGESGRAILARLEREGFIRSALLARLELRYELGEPRLLAGEYRFKRPISTVEILEILRKGEVALSPVTVVEGLTREETAEALSEAGFGDLAKLHAAFADPSRVADLDRAATSLEGYLFPDTYRFPAKIAEGAIADAMIENFRRRAADVVAAASAGDARNLHDTVVLASIVEKEAKRPEERGLIAGVYANRLDLKMGLFADPTVIYALKLAGRYRGSLRRDDLEIESPYNTYRVAGLPPGPICSPGLSSLEAAAAPARAPYLYFVARNDGTHAFAATLAEHNRNVDRFQRHPERGRGAKGGRGAGSPLD